MSPKSTIHSAVLVLFASAIVPMAQADTFGTGANTFTIDFTQIGNPGNVADTTGFPNPAGAVAYNYAIGTYEVSRFMVDQANGDGGLGITLRDLTLAGGNDPNKPATGVSWNEAARFVNYLNVSSGYSPAYKFSTQPGGGGYSADADIQLWLVGDAGFDPANPYRNSLAYYVLPTLHEWYKAAYHNPVNGTYVNFPTGSDLAPTVVTGGTDPDTAVYAQSSEHGPSFITDAGGLSLYGTMGQGGNVWEWNETAADGSNDASTDTRTIRGASWQAPGVSLSSSWTASANPTMSLLDTGFRVVLVPESSGWALLWLAPAVAWLTWRRRVAR